MNDTSPEMERKYHELLMSRSGADRIRMACSMFATARALFLAGLGPMDEREKRVQLFLHFYGEDFEPAERERIVHWIRREWKPG